MLGVFSIDLILPLGIAGGVPYITVILASLWLHNYKYVISLAAICTILTLIGFYFSPSGGELWKVIANRGLAVYAIWVTAILAIKWESTIKMNSHLIYETEKRIQNEKVYSATMRSTLHITNNLLNQLKIVELEIQNHPNFDREVITLFEEMRDEANTLLRKLASVETINEEAIIQSVYPK